MDKFACVECGQVVTADEYHPLLFCRMFKMGISNQTHYLNEFGWFFDSSRTSVRSTTSVASRY